MSSDLWVCPCSPLVGSAYLRDVPALGQHPGLQERQTHRWRKREREKQPIRDWDLDWGSWLRTQNPSLADYGHTRPSRCSAGG